MRRILMLAMLLTCGVRAEIVRADDDDPLKGLSGATALEYAKALSDDKMQGRRSGFPSGKWAEDWMIKELGNMGVTPMDPDGLYASAFNFGTSHVSKPIVLEVMAKTAEYGPDFVDLLYTGGGKVEAEVVFVGYGICAKDRGLDDYAGVDVKGKIVLALRGAPPAREAEFLAEKFIGAKSSLAADRGAAAFLICEGKAAVPGTIQNQFVRPDLPALWISQALADSILKGPPPPPPVPGEAPAAPPPPPPTLDGLKKELEAGTSSKSFATGTKVKVEVNAKYYPSVEARNVVGGFRGKDPDLRNEAIVVGAHLDHLGTDAMGRVYNGADDNASGSASLLMLLKTLTENNWAPKRNVVFVWFAGEEQGLAGSRAMAINPIPEVRNIVAMINMDMTGQGKPSVALGGRDGYPALWNRMMTFLPAADRTVLNPFRVEENSDHWPFHERGIPAFFAHTDGEHPNYHQLGDDSAHLKPECLEAAARVVGRLLVGLADIPTPLRTGREAATYVLHEGARVVTGPGSAKALVEMLARTREAPADRSAFVDPGWSAVIVPIDERTPADGATWTKLDDSIRRRSMEAVLMRTAGDLVNGPKAGRTAILPRYICFDSARKSPVDFTALRTQGVRFIDPFDPAKPPTDAERDAVLSAAVTARLIVDLTGLPTTALAAARVKLGTHPAMLRVSAPLAGDARAAATALTDRRKALGPDTLVLLSGGAEAAALSAAALSATSDPTLAPVAVVSEDTPALETLLAPISGDLEEPKGAMRLRVKELFGGAIAAFMRRIL